MDRNESWSLYLVSNFTQGTLVANMFGSKKCWGGPLVVVVIDEARV